jgi:hypothetical protein
MSSEIKTQQKLDPLDVKHRYERMNRDYNLELNAEYFSSIHNRSLARIYEAFKGNAPSLLKKINKHLDVIEQREKSKQL